MNSGETVKENNRKQKSHRGKTWGIVLLVLAALTLIKLIALPYGIGYGAKRWILANGGDNFSVRNIDFNPFTATLALHDLEIGREGLTTLQIPNLKLHMAWRPLLDSRIVIKGLTIKGIELDIDHSQPDSPPLIGGILLPVAGDTTATEDSPWKLQLERLTLVESTLRYQHQQLSSELVIDKLWLTDLESLQPETPANLSFQGRVDSAKLDITGQLTPFATHPGFEGEIKLTNLALDHYSTLIKPAVTQLGGSLTLQSRLSAKQGAGGTIKISQRGVINLGSLKLATPQLALENSRVSWNGHLESQIALTKGRTELEVQGTLKSGTLIFRLTEGETKVSNESANWQGKIKLSLNQTDTKLSSTGTLNVRKLVANLAQTEVSVEQLSLSNQAMELQQQSGATTIDHQGDLALTTLTLTDPLLTVENQTVSWNGGLQLDSDAAKGLSLTTKGSLGSNQLKGFLISSDTELGYSELTWQGEAQLNSAAESGDSEVTQQGEIHLSNATLKNPQINLTERQLNWSGEAEVKRSDEHLHFAATGALGSEQLNADLTERALALQYTALNWDGALSGQSGEALEQLNLSGTLSLDQAEVTRPEDNYKLLSLENLKVHEIKGDILERITAAHTAITHMAVGTIPAAKEGESLSLHQADSIELNESGYSPERGIAIEEIRVSGSRGRLLRDQDKKWNFTHLKESLSTTEKTPATEEGEAPPLKIGKISLHGNNRIDFEDRAIDPPLKTDITIEQLKLEQLDSNRPEQGSPLTLKAKLGQSSEINFSGVLQPFAERLTLDLKGEIIGLELPPLSPYAAPTLGYTLDSGELSADVKLKADNGILEGDNKLTIHQLDVSPLDNKVKKKVDAESVPLDTALGMLRDKNNTIKMALPITGDIDNLKIDPSDAINQAVGSAVKSGAKTYLAAALFPFGTLLTIVQAAGEEAAKMKLDPLVFKVGSDSFNGKDREYLGKIAQVLKERPEINIKLCGVAVESDRQALLAEAKIKAEAIRAAQQREKREGDKEKVDKGETAQTVPAPTISDEQLLELAKRRTQTIEKHLIDQHKTKPDRLISCKPHIEKKPADAKPRADLLI
ncbi:MAG: DUF748 domain-containing protein [Candidatus Sedimenticola sp. (ex Thyasira tokunagai)]